MGFLKYCNPWIIFFFLTQSWNCIPNAIQTSALNRPQTGGIGSSLYSQNIQQKDSSVFPHHTQLWVLTSNTYTYIITVFWDDVLNIYVSQLDCDFKQILLSGVFGKVKLN